MKDNTKLKLLKILTGIYPRQSDKIPGVNSIDYEQSKEDWKNLSPQEKQQKRRFYLENAIKRGMPINYVYYEKMIGVYDQILDRIKKIEKLIANKELEKVDIGLLNISALFFIEKDYIDETINPTNHISTESFSKLAKKFHKVYPELKLSGFAQVYARMYRFWPIKPNMPDYEIISMNEKSIILESLSSKFKHDRELFYRHVDEAILVRNKYKEVVWKLSDSNIKQENRRSFLITCKKRGDTTAVNLEYYEKMIIVYNLLNVVWEKVKRILPDKKAIENADTSLLRIASIILAERTNMDESLIPQYHFPADLFKTIANDLYDTFPDFNLPELARLYTEMFELWPNKSIYLLKEAPKPSLGNKLKVTDSTHSPDFTTQGGESHGSL